VINSQIDRKIPIYIHISGIQVASLRPTGKLCQWTLAVFTHVIIAAVHGELTTHQRGAADRADDGLVLVVPATPTTPNACRPR
jgi:hypothetical protein